MIKKGTTFLLVLLATISLSYAQHTFSIVAIDTATKEVGSAGASCIDSSIIISDLHPGRGVIHTQAWYKASNQNYAERLMDEGYSPDQILDSLIYNDIAYQQRQYGIIDFDTATSVDTPRKTAFTGTNNSDWKGHIIGYNYTVQGNILLDSTVIADMETNFLNTPGPLADKLMAALQGAKRPGADERCFNYDSTSSLSSFIRVADPGDTTGTYKLDINVNRAPNGIEPINCLQARYNLYKNGDCSFYQAGFTQSADTIILDTIYAITNKNHRSQTSQTVKFWNQTNLCNNFWLVNGDTLAVDSPFFQHTFDSLGVYTIQMVAFADSCQDIATSQVVVRNDTIIQGGIPTAELTGQPYVIYPNPVDDHLYLRTNKKSDHLLHFKLYNLVGETVFQQYIQGNTRINIQKADLPPGMYFYRITGGTIDHQQGKISIR